ncbi:deoxyguanosinetriphosphate triphosphohydrolase family protein [Candidatus Protochlamydia phocaeensis]|uniref:deoxyguanosinetriphosphate triphosphohydrolase family protein n=1 Tax=Candidatus Protochlamydia phocaeensis TaxID=1414722 RepID=UPI000838DF18|nr:HD domain-containing protein [Candidatus Protochlamydia phocaeensis]
MSQAQIDASKHQAIDTLAYYRQVAEQKEQDLLFPQAAFSKNHTRFEGAEDDHRMPYKRDVDRILHSKAYSRYVDKTQVVYLVENDHITHRSLHVQLVSSFARGIAEILRLNLDLVEAISLGHDVGHAPFGHEGEGYLSALSIEHDNGPFCHPLQSCRLFTEIEPLNLGLAVYDGFLCHDGGMGGPVLAPSFGKTWDDHFREKKQKKSHPDNNIMPGTLEGCLVKLCDTMSYIGRDIEDAINLGILKREDIPQTFLGTTNREILGVLAADIIQHSYNKDYIAISEKSYEALRTLRRFNFKQIYVHPKLKVESSKIKHSYRILFEWLLEDLEAGKEQSYLWKNYLHKRNEKYLSQTSSVQMVIDYIAGMTDNFFVRTLEKIIVPSKIELY